MAKKKPSDPSDELLDQAQAVLKRHKITIGERLGKIVMYAPPGAREEDLEIVRKAVREGKLKPGVQA